jgi:Entner-Doudoroff aldolase
MNAALEQFRTGKASAILRATEASVVIPAMEAAVSGGFRIVEFTLTTPGALDAIAHFSKNPDLLVGAGTVLTEAQARQAVSAGAKFLVSPITDPEIIHVAAAMGVLSMPGAQTPTELYLAHRSGAELQKLFPAPAGGPSWVKAVRGPLPMLRIVPTHGVDEHNVSEWFQAGVFGVGYVAALFAAEDLLARRFDRIEHRARVLMEATRKASLA